MTGKLSGDVKLTKKEEEIMMILWDAQTPLVVSDIIEHGRKMKRELILSTTQMTINKLLKMGFVKVGAFTQVNKALARAFEPTISADELAVIKFQQAIDPLGKNSAPILFAALLENIELSEDDILELADMIEEMKEK